MPQVLSDTRPIPFDDQYRDDPDPIGTDLTRALTWLGTWPKKLSSWVKDKTVFIVHGHDEARKWELKNRLVALRLDPIILHEQYSLGMTIIEKFEYYASRCIFAFVLLTPDDIAVRESDTEEAKWRARQNVIMELGWFMGRLGRRRVIIIHKSEVETPSDIHGVLYLPIKDSVDEVTHKIRQRLKAEKIIR